MIKCKFCNGTNLIAKVVGTHTGLYCIDCGNKWNKWLSKGEVSELANQIRKGKAKAECRNITQARHSDEFQCSECGINLGWWACNNTYEQFEFKFCPNCGRKVTV